MLETRLLDEVFITVTITSNKRETMNSIKKEFFVTSQLECPSCGSNNVTSAPEIEHFQYGEEADSVMLSASIQVHHCASCGMSFTAEDASDSRHEAVCRYLGVLTPLEVRQVRELYKLSQMEFAELSKIGKASLARWENGVLIQNQANDNLLYLLTYEDNFERIRDRVNFPKTVSKSKPILNERSFVPKFRAIPTDQVERLQRDAGRFSLFPAAVAI